ncbi:sugar kinase [Streptomyces cinereospinus]|uniref:Sugar kinase n=1 Tax=Streptomyces cinereospinus TaxID=285561 RepID=A0ABV5NBN9_9ACTN
MTGALPLQAGPAGEQRAPAGDRRHVVRRRALSLLIIVLLIGIPAGYLVISANQSRNSGKDKEEKYSARGLTRGWPSKVQRRLYQVPIPRPASKVAWYETNNWRTSRLYVQFQTTHAGLDAFLTQVGVSRADLTRGDITIGSRDRLVTGWRFPGAGARPGANFGLVHEQKNPRPTQDIVVNTSNPTYPMVYVVSRLVP